MGGGADSVRSPQPVSIRRKQRVHTRGFNTALHLEIGSSSGESWAEPRLTSLLQNISDSEWSPVIPGRAGPA